jgi:hypothetical protein
MRLYDTAMTYGRSTLGFWVGNMRVPNTVAGCQLVSVQAIHCSLQSTGLVLRMRWG